MPSDTPFADPHAWPRWGYGVAAVLAGLLLLLLASDGNVALFQLINGAPWPAGAWVWSNITVLGDTMTLLCLLLPFVGRRPDLVWSIMVAVVVVSLLIHGAKMVFDMPRPPYLLSGDDIRVIGFKAVSGAFPSGHSAAAFAFAGAICLMRFPVDAKVTVLLLAAAVGVSRVAVGIHWPLDVVGGALVGWLGVMLSVWLGRRWPLGLRLNVQRTLALLLVVAALFTIWDYDGGYPLARPLLVVLPLAMLALALPGLRTLFPRRAA
jgi:membrane-associated phospholipid phosphatase